MVTQVKTKLRPLADRILIKREKEKEKISGGIIIPDNAQQKKEVGEVISVGPGKKDKHGNFIEIPVKKGDKVMWQKYGGDEIAMDDDEFVIIKAEDLIAIIE